MQNRKGFALFELLIVIVIITCVGGFIYLSVTEKKEPEVTPTPTVKPTATIVPSPTSVTTTLPYDPVDVVWEREFPMNECAGTNPVDSVNEGNISLVITRINNPTYANLYDEYLYLVDKKVNPNLIINIFHGDQEGSIVRTNIRENCRYLVIPYTYPDLNDLIIMKTDGTLITESVYNSNPEISKYSLITYDHPEGRNSGIVSLSSISGEKNVSAVIFLPTGTISSESLQVIP